MDRQYVLDKVHENYLLIYDFRIDAELYHKIGCELYKVHLYPVGFSYNNVAIYKQTKKRFLFWDYNTWELLIDETEKIDLVLMDLPSEDWFINKLNVFLKYKNN